MAVVGLAEILVQPSFKGTQAKIGKEMSGVGRTVGTSMGKSTAQGFSEAASALKTEVSQLEKTITSSQSVIAGSKKKIATASDAESKALGALRVAELKLEEVRNNSKATAAQIATAEERLEEARRKASRATSGREDAERELAQATGELEKAQKRSSQASEELEREMESTRREAEKSGKSFGVFGEKAGSAFKLVAGAAAGLFAIDKVTDFFGAAITGAGDLQQSVGAIDSVFKSNSGQMHEWAKNAATDVGLTKNEFNELGTLIGAQLKNGGTAMDELAPKTNQLIGLGADLSSMFGGTTKEAVEALSSALKGERDPIERYGVSLNQSKIDAEAAALGYKKVGKEWEDGAQQAATLSLVMKQTTDAHGNFAREGDTFAGAQQRMNAQWSDLTTKIGEMFLPMLSSAIGFISEKALPAFDGFVAGLASTGQWIRDNAGWLVPLTVAVAGYAAAMGTLSIISTVRGWIAAATAAQWGLNVAMSANPIGIVVALIIGLVAAIVWLYNNNETARKIINGAWTGIQNAVRFAWEKVIKPAFEAISNFVTKTLGPIFQWIYEKIIKPVWSGISTAVQIAWALIETYFLAMKWAIENIIAPIFRWVYEKIIKPIWDGISKFIGDTWNQKIKPIFDALGKFIEEKVAPAFKKGVKAIEDIFNGIRNIAAKPINFVIQTVYNDGLRKALNKVRSIVGGDPLPELATIPAFAKGGQMGRGWKLVGEEGPELINTGPGFVYTASQTEKMLAGKSQMPLDALSQTNPMQAHEGIGGFVEDAWGAITGGLKAATDWVRGGLANAAGLLLNPIKDGLAALLPDTGLGDIAQRAATSVIDGALSWIRGKDAADLAAGKGSYSGPLGAFFRPAGGFITSGFGASRGAYPHAGIDFAVPIGSMVRAMFGGIVQKTAWNAVAGRSGKGLVMGHGDGMSSYYGHLSDWVAKPGQKVKAGDVIARSGNTGRSTGPHLHAELWKNGDPFNFASYLHDNGGVLNPGLSMILNNSRKPEAILNNQQWADVHKLALSGGNGVTYAPTYQYLGENPEQVAARDRARLMDVLNINGIS